MGNGLFRSINTDRAISFIRINSKKNKRIKKYYKKVLINVKIYDNMKKDKKYSRENYTEWSEYDETRRGY